MRLRWRRLGRQTRIPAPKSSGNSEGGPGGRPHCSSQMPSDRNCGLIRLQVAIALPLRNVLAEIVPLCLLRAGEALEDVIAKGFPDQRVGLHLNYGLAQRRR